MDSILERLLVLAAPLFAVQSANKKKSVAKKRAKPAKNALTPVKSARKQAKLARRAKSAQPKAQARKPKFAIRARSAQAKFPLRKMAPEKPASKAGAPTAPVKVAPPPPPPPKPVPPMGRPRLLFPENGKFADSVTPTFRWLSVGGAKQYEVFWSPDPNLSSGHSMVSTATEGTIPPNRPLTIGLTYYWRVRGGNEAGWGPWSAAASFSALEESA